MIKSHNRSFLLRELQALACQVTGEEVSLIEGDASASWSWNWIDRVITVDHSYLTENSADVCRAILLHESAHCAITRIQHLYPVVVVDSVVSSVMMAGGGTSSIALAMASGG